MTAASNKKKQKELRSGSASSVISEQLESEQKLLEKAKRGDQRAFTKIVYRYEQLVFRFAFKLCRDEPIAEEILQDTFVNVYRALPRFSGKSKFTTWLYRIVVNNCLMRRRERARQSTLSIDDEKFPLDVVTAQISRWSETPMGSVLNAELREALDRAIDMLPMEYRTVFVLRDVEELPAKEVANILKLTVPAVKSRLRRARLFLREQLKEYFVPG
ncbi:MAG: RNA polymerase sigma factor [Bacteroidota bacterium]